jgi:hypothetical protein
MLRKILICLLKLFGLYEDKSDTATPFRMQTLYEIKPFMTEYERRIYSILLKLGDDYKIIPQVNMASIIRKKNNDHYYSDLFRNIDFAIFDKDCNNLLMLIEIDDSTHNSYKRRQRDEKVNNICHDVGIKILHFYTSYPNEEGYVLNRILKNLNNNIDNKVNNTEENNTYTLVR